MKKFLLALLAFISISCPAFAANWVCLGRSNNGELVYLDKDSVVKSHETVTGWVKYIVADGSKVLGQYSARKSDRSMAIASFVIYDAVGNIIVQNTPSQLNYETVVSDSMGELIYNSILGNAKSNT